MGVLLPGASPKRLGSRDMTRKLVLFLKYTIQIGVSSPQKRLGRPGPHSKLLVAIFFILIHNHGNCFL